MTCRFIAKILQPELVRYDRGGIARPLLRITARIRTMHAVA
jgi:hypothetical protein